MAIKKLPSGWYQIDFRDRNRERHRESYPTKREAQEQLDAKRTAVRKGEYVAPKEIPAFKTMAELWFNSKKVNAGKNKRPVKETTLDHWKNHIDSYLVPAFGDYRLDQIESEAIERQRLSWRDENKLAPITVNKLLTTMTAIFNEAMRRNKCKQNPAATAQRLGVGSIEAGEKENEQVRPEEVYNADELNRLIQAAELGLFKTLIFTVAMTGIRHGEALGLQWGDLDLTAGKITIRRTWPDKWRDDEPIFYVPKSKHGVREIPIPAEFVQALKRWKLSCPISKWDLVFPKKDGNPHDRSTILRSGLYPAIRRAEVKKLDMHALRHTFASLLLSQGTPITEVSSYLGHADPQITLKVYSHWIPRMKTDSISRLADMILGAKAAENENTAELREVSTAK
jgi:integrase